MRAFLLSLGILLILFGCIISGGVGIGFFEGTSTYSVASDIIGLVACGICPIIGGLILCKCGISPRADNNLSLNNLSKFGVHQEQLTNNTCLSSTLRFEMTISQILWSIYVWAITLLIICVYFDDDWHKMTLRPTIDLILVIPALLALHFHIRNKKIGPPIFWKTYIISYLIWELVYNLVLQPITFRFSVLITLLIMLPLYVGNFRYAYREWDNNEPPIYDEYKKGTKDSALES